MDLINHMFGAGTCGRYTIHSVSRRTPTGRSLIAKQLILHYMSTRPKPLEPGGSQITKSGAFDASSTFILSSENLPTKH